MPDIAMCQNKECPSRNQCYRFRAVPTKGRQSYMAFDPKEDGKCSDFVQIFTSDELTPVEE